MKRKWSVTKLMATGSLAVLTLVFQLAGAGIAAATGVPLTSGLINVFVSPAMLVLCLLVVDQVGVATIYMTVLGVLQLPLPLTGIPGFLPKVLILLVIGVLVDVVCVLLRRTRLIASLVIGGLDMFLAGLGTVEIGRLFGMPGVEQAADLFYSPIGIVGALVGGAIGGLVGWLIYSRIRNSTVVVRIQGE